MNIKVKRIVVTGSIVAMMCTGMTGCRKPYNTPEFVTIEPHQTAFLIPLVGDTGNQASFESEKMLKEAKISAKEVEMPHRWVQTGRHNWEGEWRDTMKLVLVDRSPVTREWSQASGTGTSVKNQAIYAESSESIAFSAGMNCSAQIYSEDDAVKFLYCYNNKPLSEIMDSEIRAMVEAKFNEECGKKTMNGILKSKEEIMDNVRNYVIPYFKEKGITITVLGMKDGIVYQDPNIQKSINEKFSSEMKLTTQENENKRIVSEAQAKADAKILAAEAQSKADALLSQNLTPALIEKAKIEKWDGKYPQFVGDSTPIINVGE